MVTILFYCIESNLILTGQKENSLYTIYLKVNVTKERSLLMKEKETALLEWHERLGHPGKVRLQLLTKGGRWYKDTRLQGKGREVWNMYTGKTNKVSIQYDIRS